MKLKYNYHTHTYRCHHASGTDREYVERAIQSGIQVLGFSDHSPYFFEGDYYSKHRMRPEETAEYIASIRSLQKEFADQITLLIGYEAEYYPKFFSRTASFLADTDCDYLIQGQHFIGNEERTTAHVTDDFQLFDQYIHQTIEGMETGMFTYLCHPDICQYSGDAHVQEKYYTKLCETALRLDLPLELNMYGLADHRHYPSEAFYRVAKEVGNEIVAGFDAHDPNRFVDPNEMIALNAFVDRCGLVLSELSPERVLARKANIR